jgi:putative peptidoglycan lipid II flippase
MTQKKTVNTVLLVIYLTVFSKAFGLLRDILIGYRYGTSMESDAYFAAYRMSITIFLSIGSAITATTIPFIVKFIKSGEQLHLQSFINKLISAMAIIGALIAGVGLLLAPFYTRIIAVGFEGEKLELTVKMVRIFFPVIILVPLVYLMISILQANERFAVTSMISIPYNAVLITYLILVNSRYGITGLAFATLIGWGGQFLLLYLFAREDRPRFQMSFEWDNEIKNFFKLMAPILLSSAVYNINILVDSSIASTLADGQLSSLNFANIAYTAIATTSIYGISTVLFPQFSALVAENRISELRHKIAQSVEVMIFIFMPVIFGIIAINRELIQVLYQRGTFGIESVGFTSSALVFYVMGMIGFAFQELSNKVFYALKDTRTPFVTSAISVAMNIVLNLIFVRFWGIRGLALATSIAVTFNGIILIVLIQKRIGKLDVAEIIRHFIKILMISLIMLAGVYGFNQLPINLYLRMTIAILLGITLYYIMSDRMNLTEIQYIKKEINSLRKNRKGA